MYTLYIVYSMNIIAIVYIGFSHIWINNTFWYFNKQLVLYVPRPVLPGDVVKFGSVMGTGRSFTPFAS